MKRGPLNGSKPGRKLGGSYDDRRAASQEMVERMGREVGEMMRARQGEPPPAPEPRKLCCPTCGQPLE